MATKKQMKKADKVFKEYKAGTLNIGKSKKKVTSRKQAIAVALSVSGQAKKKKKQGGMARIRIDTNKHGIRREINLDALYKAKIKKDQKKKAWLEKKNKTKQFYYIYNESIK